MTRQRIRTLHRACISATATLLLACGLNAHAQEQGCYTCTANACIGTYEHELQRLHEQTAEQVSAYENEYVELDNSQTEEIERVLAARQAVLSSEEQSVSVLFHDLITCLQRAVEPQS